MTPFADAGTRLPEARRSTSVRPSVFPLPSRGAPLRRYRTEILIPPDRTVVLQLPASLPEGWATVTIHASEPDKADHPESDPDHQDIEWWDEFDEETDVDAS